MQKIISNYFTPKNISVFKEWADDFENAAILVRDKKIKIIIDDQCLEEIEKDLIEFLQNNVEDGCLAYFVEIFCDGLESDARCLIIRDEEFTFLNFKDYIYEFLEDYSWRDFYERR